MTIRLHLEPSDVLDFADGTVDPSQRDALERHLSNCAQCRALVVESLRDDEVTAPAGPSRVGRFIIHGRLGVGAMGMVFDATDPHLERRVALKICKGSGVTINQRRVLDEARTMARLNHPNVVCVYEAGFSGDEVFLVMERVGGGTLLEFVRQHAEQTDRLIALFLEAGAGLAAAHRAGVVHRDFKPENVLIDQYGHAKVTDFGLATSAPERVLAGTPSYLAPEVLRGGVATPASDQFSFCVALFEALAGRHPSRTRTLPVWCADRATRRALDRGLSVDPCDRFESMDALLDALGAGRQRRERLATLSLGLSGLVSWVIGS